MVTTSMCWVFSACFFLVCEVVFTSIHVFSSLTRGAYTGMSRVFLEGKKITTFSRKNTNIFPESSNESDGKVCK